MRVRSGSGSESGSEKIDTDSDSDSDPERLTDIAARTSAKKYKKMTGSSTETQYLAPTPAKSTPEQLKSCEIVKVLISVLPLCASTVSRNCPFSKTPAFTKAVI